MAGPVVFLPFLLIRKNLVCFGNFSEPGLMKISMAAAGQFPIGPLDLLYRGIPPNPEDVVIVFL